jgi:hypothetical protein
MRDLPPAVLEIIEGVLKSAMKEIEAQVERTAPLRDSMRFCNGGFHASPWC